MMKYPEFEQDSDDEDDEEEEDEENDADPIKLPKIITKETVLAILKPNVVSLPFEFLLYHPIFLSFNLQLTLTLLLLKPLPFSPSKPLSTFALSRMLRLSSFPSLEAS